MFKKILSKLFRIKSKETTNAENRKVNSDDTNQEETSNTDYQNITAEDFALQNGIEYISDITQEKISSNIYSVNNYYAIKNKYILLYPPNDGQPTCPFQWYGIFDEKYRIIMNNQSSFKEITNLSEIILQMVNLYSKYIDEDIFISWNGFAIKLEDEVTPDYHGRATFVLTKDSIRNNKVKPEKIIEAKKYFINDFLDHYIGWNFGVVVTNNPELQKALVDFNRLVIKKGLREYAGTGLDVWCSDDVKHYDFERV